MHHVTRFNSNLWILPWWLESQTCKLTMNTPGFVATGWLVARSFILKFQQGFGCPPATWWIPSTKSNKPVTQWGISEPLKIHDHVCTSFTQKFNHWNLTKSKKEKQLSASFAVDIRPFQVFNHKSTRPSHVVMASCNHILCFRQVTWDGTHFSSQFSFWFSVSFIVLGLLLDFQHKHWSEKSHKIVVEKFTQIKWVYEVHLDFASWMHKSLAFRFLPRTLFICSKLNQNFGSAVTHEVLDSLDLSWNITDKGGCNLVTQQNIDCSRKTLSGQEGTCLLPPFKPNATHMAKQQRAEAETKRLNIPQNWITFLVLKTVAMTV